LYSPGEHHVQGQKPGRKLRRAQLQLWKKAERKSTKKKGGPTSTGKIREIEFDRKREKPKLFKVRPFVSRLASENAFSEKKKTARKTAEGVEEFEGK